jgi:hypothetical protein
MTDTDSAAPGARPSAEERDQLPAPGLAMTHRSEEQGARAHPRRAVTSRSMCGSDPESCHLWSPVASTGGGRMTLCMFLLHGVSCKQIIAKRQ